MFCCLFKRRNRVSDEFKTLVDQALNDKDAMIELLRQNNQRLEAENGSMKQKLEQIRECMQCPITNAVMMDPCCAPDGHMYDGYAIATWRQTKNSSPMTGVEFQSNFVYTSFTGRNIVEILSS
jgi:hypothetical protein